MLAQNVQFGWLLQSECGNPYSINNQWILPTSSGYSSFNIVSTTKPEFKLQKNDTIAATLWVQDFLTGGTATSVYLPRKIVIDQKNIDFSYSGFGKDSSQWPKHPYSLNPRLFESDFLGGLAAKDIEMMGTALKDEFNESDPKDYETFGAPKTRAQAEKLISVLKESGSAIDAIYYFK